VYDEGEMESEEEKEDDGGGGGDATFQAVLLMELLKNKDIFEFPFVSFGHSTEETTAFPRCTK
jgi:hypothetical protein